MIVTFGMIRQTSFIGIPVGNSFTFNVLWKEMDDQLYFCFGTKVDSNRARLSLLGWVYNINQSILVFGYSK